MRFIASPLSPIHRTMGTLLNQDVSICEKLEEFRKVAHSTATTPFKAVFM
ncbi:MAG TPA: hypothetical protein VN367_04880 [Chlorobaculum sp.]|nr:hypothetical protein [Chlorobaculum sp.]